MKNCAIVLLFLVILMSSCNNKVKDPILSNFKSLHDAEYVFIDIDKENFGDPYGLIVIDSVLITLDVSDSYNLKIYNLKNGEFLGDYLIRGKGPNELIMPMNIGKISNNKFFVFGQNLQKLICFSVNNINGNLILEVFKEYNFDKSNGKFFRAIVTTNYIIGTGIFESGRYGIYDLNGRFVKTIYDYPYDVAHKDELNVFKGLAYQSNIAYNNNLQKLVLVDDGVMEVLDMKDSAIVKSVDCIYYLTEYKSISEGGGQSSAQSKSHRKGFMNVESSDKYIFTLHSGKSYEEASIGAYQPKNLLIFNWSGEAVKGLKFPFPIFSLYYDNENDFLYGIVNDPFPRIVMLNLDKNLLL